MLLNLANLCLCIVFATGRGENIGLWILDGCELRIFGEGDANPCQMMKCSYCLWISWKVNKFIGRESRGLCSRRCRQHTRRSSEKIFSSTRTEKMTQTMSYFYQNMQTKRKTGSGLKKEKYFHESKDWIKMYKTISDSNAPSMWLGYIVTGSESQLCKERIRFPD